MDKKGKSFETKTIIIFLVIVTAIIFFILALIAINYKAEKKTPNKKTTELISITYSNKYNGIKLNGVKPTKDTDGIKEKDNKKYFNFNIASKIKDKTVIDYEVAIKKSSECNIPSKDLKIYLERENEGTYSKVFEPKEFKELTKKSKIGTPKKSMILFDGSYSSSMTDKYRLKVWLNEKSSVKDTKCAITVDVYGKVR